MDFLLSGMNEGKGMTHKSMIANFQRIIEVFKAVPVAGEQKVRVGVVGEIYVKYSPLGNNNLEHFLLSEGPSRWCRVWPTCHLQNLQPGRGRGYLRRQVD